MLLLWLLGIGLLALDTVLILDTFGIRQRLSWFGHPDPRVHVPAWAIVLLLTVAPFWLLLLGSDFPREFVVACRAWWPACKW